MPSRISRAATEARTQILGELIDDHKRVKKAYRDFQKLDPHEDAEAVEEIVQQVLAELEIHATLEEELLYPAAREGLPEEDLVDEAEVEHESARTLMEQLKGMSPEDEKYAARFTVLCEYVAHHVKEEEKEMFPQLERARIDWESLAQQMTERREELTAELMGEEADEDEEDDDSETEGADEAEGSAVAETVTSEADDDETDGGAAPKPTGSRRKR